MKEYDVIINIELEYLNMKKSIIIILSGFLVFQNIVAENFEHYIDNLMKETKIVLAILYDKKCLFFITFK